MRTFLGNFRNTPTNGDDHCDGDQDDVDYNVGYDDGDDNNTFLENFSNTPTSLSLWQLIIIITGSATRVFISAKNEID